MEALPNVELLQELLGTSGYTASEDDLRYMAVLGNDVIGKVRSFVNTARSSSLRREALADSIKEANTKLAFGPGQEVNPETQLLHDMDVRWSSQFFMIDRYLFLVPVRRYPFLLSSY